MVLESYAVGDWVTGGGDREMLLHAVTGEPVAEITGGGLDYAAMLTEAREVGGPALRRLTFHQRARCLKALARYLLERKETYYARSSATGATRTDSWIDIEGGIGELFALSSKVLRDFPDSTVLLDGTPERSSRTGIAVGQQVCLSREGAAIHLNAYNFPCAGLLGKLAPCLLAGVAAIVKPARQTAYLSESMFRDIVASGLLPRGSVQFIAGGCGDLLDQLNAQDVIAFTGSAATASTLRRHSAVMTHGTRFDAESHALNCSVLGPDAAPGNEEFELFTRMVIREMTLKVGQRGTAIRRALVPLQSLEAVRQSLIERLKTVLVGNPESEGVNMGPLVSLAQRDEVRSRLAGMSAEAEIVFGDPDFVSVKDGDHRRGAFMGPILLRCPEPMTSERVHEIEAFGPVCTLMAYDGSSQAATLMRRGVGSRIGAVFTGDEDFAREVLFGAGPCIDRLLIVNRHCAGVCEEPVDRKESEPPPLIFGDLYGAGESETADGTRGITRYMQRVAFRGDPDTLTGLVDCWMPGSARREMEVHPFRKHFDELEPGDTVLTARRTVTLEDIENFAALSGDMFYLHMDEAAAAANPFFEGRAAHGQLIVSLAAGLFVDPAPGPVLASYGLENLRFMQPVYPEDTLRVALTCKQKTVCETEAYGKVCWDVTVVNQESEVVARYDVLTLVARV